MRSFNTLIVFYDVFVPDLPHNFDFIVQELFQKLSWHFVLGDNFYSHSCFVRFGICELR